MKQNTALLTTEQNEWRLYADEKDMLRAENTVLGGYDQHRSQLDWEPFDGDDDRPDQCDRYISWDPGRDSDRFERAMKVAGFLGSKCWIRVYVQTPSWSASLRSDTREIGDAYLQVARITGEVHKRIRAAINMLSGFDDAAPLDIRAVGPVQSAVDTPPPDPA